MIDELNSILSQGKDLTSAQMQTAMEEIMSGEARVQQIVDFLNYLNKKGQTQEELTAAVNVMRQHVTRINTKHRVILDTCGTGGDRLGTFNVSTCVAFVASGCGIAVAKHGNRSVSSLCGSADILEALGINIHMDKEKLQRCLDEIGIAFLFAQELHPAMKYAMPARKQIGTKTIFNILGPLTNPAGATHQLVGIYDGNKTDTIAEVLNNLGTIHALIVHGEDGMDEISTTAKTKVAQVYRGKVKSYKICPEDFGFRRVSLEELSGGDANYNAKVLLDILGGMQGPRRDIVILNAAAAIYVADKSKSIEEGIKLACESIDSGMALKKFELLKEFSLQG